MSVISPKYSSRCYYPQSNGHDQQNGSERSLDLWEHNIEIWEFHYGITVYPFQQPILAYFKPLYDTENHFEFCVDKLFPPIGGIGATKKEARADWERSFHLNFEKIYTKCTWERDENEKNLWKILEDIVDIPAYLKKTPLNFQQTGKIISKQEQRIEIEWVGGRKDIIDCPPDLVSYKLGEYFRADLLREYQTDRLIEILSVNPSNYREYTDKEIEDFINSLPSTQDLPNSTIWK